jgi:RNA polymerase sigma-70 factor (ECF subfamily)
VIRSPRVAVSLVPGEVVQNYDEESRLVVYLSAVAEIPRVAPAAFGRPRGRLYDVGLVENTARDETAVADARAVARVAAGDADALRELYDRHGRLVFSMAYRLTSDRQLAEECVQDVFVNLWRRASEYDSERAKVTTWLFVITRNRAIELARARSRRPDPHADVEIAGQAPDPADLLGAADEAQRVAEAIAALPQVQIEVLQLAYFDGLTHVEIAERLGLPLGTVKGRLRLALDRLRLLAERYELEVENR